MPERILCAAIYVDRKEGARIAVAAGQVEAALDPVGGEILETAAQAAVGRKQGRVASGVELHSLYGDPAAAGAAITTYITSCIAVDDLELEVERPTGHR